jgi:hypothetical protein
MEGQERGLADGGHEFQVHLVPTSNWILPCKVSRGPLSRWRSAIILGHSNHLMKPPQSGAENCKVHTYNNNSLHTLPPPLGPDKFCVKCGHTSPDSERRRLAWPGLASLKHQHVEDRVQYLGSIIHTKVQHMTWAERGGS